MNREKNPVNSRPSSDRPDVPATGSEKAFRPLVFGETLFDQFPDGTRVPGGAPFNVAWHLRGFKANPLLVSAVGTDAGGKDLRKRMSGWGVDLRGIQRNPSRPTGRVVVELEEGEPRFNIVAQQAYDEIDLRRLPPPSVLSGVDLLYHGTLALREDTSLKALVYLRDTLPGRILVDINLRDPWWTRRTLTWALRGADCVKLNQYEAALLTGVRAETQTGQREAAEKLRKRYRIRQIVLTLGAEGALAVGDGEVLRQESPVVSEFQDAVGAGDAFSAVLALGIHHAWPLALTLERAVAFAADLCRVRGATQDDPHLYERHRSQWNHGH
jgi:fructokinase